MEPAATKRCSKCGTPKPLTDFYKQRDKKDGLRCSCKACCSTTSAERYARNPEPFKANNRKWFKENPGKAAVYSRKWRTQNPEKQKAAQLNWYYSNLEHCSVKNAVWHAQNPEKRQASHDKWNVLNPERVAASQAKRRAAKLGADGSHTLAEWVALCLEFSECCVRCWKHVGLKKLTRDHIVALDNGGSHDISNIQPLCKSCNSSKGTRHSTDYRPFEPNINLILQLAS